MFSEGGYIIFFFLFLPYIESADRLNEYISHYEPLNYNSAEVHKEHLKARRSTAKDTIVHVSFGAFEREFKLILKRDLTVFNQNLEVRGSSGPVEVDASHIYHGHLIDEPDSSSVFGSLSDGVFEGKIISPKGSYYVEKAHHYFPHEKHSNRTFHSIIYHEDHVQDPHESKRHGHEGGCGITDDIIQWMSRIQNSAVNDGSLPIPTPKPKEHKKATEPSKPKEEIILLSNEDRYSREASQEKQIRHKRATRFREEIGTTCPLFIRTDPLIWRHIREGFPEHADPSKRLEVDEKTREEILSLIAHHVTAANYIYRGTKFDGRSEHRNIKFQVQRIKIDDESACRCTNADCKIDPFCEENIDVGNFLNIHSLGNHDDFCLAYVFTYRDFTGGILGLAWQASASGTSGGICEKYKTYTETIGGIYQSTKRSLNTGIVTLVNYNSRVPPKVSQLMLAHEIGHNFGSPHDYPLECKPGGVYGNYIMFGSATNGDRPNNSKFSACSIRNISNVLDSLEDNKMRNCFITSDSGFCGNKIVEAGEECDCGYDMEECTEKCCYPRTGIKGCQRREGARCSPSEGPCCNEDTCSYISLDRNEVCKVEFDCSRSSRCDGTSAECPSPTPRPDKTRCNNGTQLCIAGECSGSICLEWNLTACSLSSQENPDMDKRRLCELACRNGTDVCRSTSEFVELVNLPLGGISLMPGSPCDNFQGYCDVSLNCIPVNADGPLFAS